MNCPNCGTYYTENEKICKKCHTPLSNAIYNPVEHAEDNQNTSNKKKRFAPIIAVLLIFCIITAGIGGYFYYISRVKQGCRDATKQIFTYAKNMDFSDVAPSDLPEPLKSEPNVRELVKKQLKTYIGDSQLGSLVDVDSIDVDTLCNEMVEQASYKITDISATYNSCTVTVTTKNIDFYSLPETIYDEIKSEITDGTSSLWTSIKNSISSLLGGSDQTTIEKIDMVEIDELVVEVSKKYLPMTACCFDDPRLQIYYQDGLKFVRGKENEYDLIIVDSTDPFGPGEGLFTKEFYGNCYKALNDTGIMVNQHESPFYQEDAVAMQRAHKRIVESFPISRVYQAHIPTYPSGHWLFGFASKKYHPIKDFQKTKWNARGMKTKYYNTGIHVGSFALPNYVEELLRDVE